MDAAAPFDVSAYDVVLFALSTHTLAEALARMLRPRWAAWIEPGRQAWVVGIELGPAAQDLALLLRQVSVWAGTVNLATIPFDVDCRTYELVAAAEPSPSRRGGPSTPAEPGAAPSGRS